MNEIQEIIDLVALAKMTKCAVFLIKDGDLLGTDEEYSYISKIGIHSSRPYAFVVKEVNDFINDKEFKAGDCIIDGNKLVNLKLGKAVSIYFSVYDIKISSMYLKILDTKNICVYKESFTGLREDPKFEAALSLKSAEGIYKYYVGDRYLTALFSGFLPVNKPDKVDVCIYDRADHLFLSDFTIYKAKNITISIMVYYMKM